MRGKSALTGRASTAYAHGMAQRQSAEPSSDLVILGARIARAVREKGLTQTDVARTLGVRNATVGDWVAGRFAPRGDNLRRLAEVLGMSARSAAIRMSIPSTRRRYSTATRARVRDLTFRVAVNA